MARIIDGENKNLIGGNLKKLRTKLKLSQQDLSNKLELLGSMFAEALSPELKITPARLPILSFLQLQTFSALILKSFTAKSIN